MQLKLLKTFILLILRSRTVISSPPSKVKSQSSQLTCSLTYQSFLDDNGKIIESDSLVSELASCQQEQTLALLQEKGHLLELISYAGYHRYLDALSANLKRFEKKDIVALILENRHTLASIITAAYTGHPKALNAILGHLRAFTKRDLLNIFKSSPQTFYYWAESAARSPRHGAAIASLPPGQKACVKAFNAISNVLREFTKQELFMTLNNYPPTLAAIARAATSGYPQVLDAISQSLGKFSAYELEEILNRELDKQVKSGTLFDSALSELIRAATNGHPLALIALSKTLGNLLGNLNKQNLLAVLSDENLFFLNIVSLGQKKETVQVLDSISPALATLTAQDLYSLCSDGHNEFIPAIFLGVAAIATDGHPKALDALSPAMKEMRKEELFYLIKLSSGFFTYIALAALSNHPMALEAISAVLIKFATAKDLALILDNEPRLLSIIQHAADKGYSDAWHGLVSAFQITRATDDNAYIRYTWQSAGDEHIYSHHDKDAAWHDTLRRVRSIPGLDSIKLKVTLFFTTLMACAVTWSRWRPLHQQKHQIEASGHTTRRQKKTKSFTDHPPESPHHLVKLTQLFRLDSIAELEQHIQRCSPILEQQSIAFFAQLSDTDQADLITHIYQWYGIFNSATPPAPHSSLLEQDHHTKVSQCVNVDPSGDWGVVLEPHQQFQALQYANRHTDLTEDVAIFLTNLERSFYIKAYGLDLDTTAFTAAVQAHYQTLTTKVQLVGSNIQTKYQDFGTKILAGLKKQLTKHYSRFISNCKGQITYYVVRDVPHLYYQIDHPDPENTEIHDINTYLKQYPMQLPDQAPIPKAFTSSGVITATLALYKALNDPEDLAAIIGEKTLSCLSSCYKQFNGKELSVTVADLQGLLKDMQNNAKMTKSSCLFWSYRATEPSQLQQQGLFQPVAMTTAISVADKRLAVNAKTTLEGSHSDAAVATHALVGTVSASNGGIDNDHPDKIRLHLITAVNEYMDTIKSILETEEIRDEMSPDQKSLLSQILTHLSQIRDCLDNLYKRNFDAKKSLTCLNLISQSQLNLSKIFAVAKQQSNDHSEFCEFIFTETTTTYEAAQALIASQRKLLLAPAHGNSIDYQPPQQPLHTHHRYTSTPIHLSLTLYIIALRHEARIDNGKALIRFLEKTYTYARSLRTRDIEEERLQKCFESIANQLLYFIPLQECLNPEVRIQEIIKALEVRLFTGQSRPEDDQTAAANAAIIFHVLVDLKREIVTEKLMFLLFGLHDCTKAAIDKSQKPRAVHKLIRMRNIFCHPAMAVAADKESSMSDKDIAAILAYFRPYIVQTAAKTLRR